MSSEMRFSGMPPVEVGKNREDEFYSLVETLDEGTQRTAGFKKIVDAVEDSGDFDNGMLQLKQFLDRRNSSLDTITVRKTEGGRDVDIEDAKKTVNEIRLIMNFPERFLGNGATADVFTLRKSFEDQSGMICAKVVKDYARYAEGLPIFQELDVLDSVRDLNVEGVRAPIALFGFSSIRFDGFAMEQLAAVNFRRILEGQTTEGVKDALPEGFNVNEYFGRLRAYVTELHKRGIVHNDLYLRNMMVDRATGMPRIIDFGKARLDRDLDKTKTTLTDEAKKDFATLQAAEAEVKIWLAGQS